MTEQFKSIKLILYRIILKFLTLLLSIILFFTFPILITLSVPIFIFRYLIKQLAKYFRPDLDMITTRGQIFATDDIYNYPKCNVIVAMTLQGNLDFEKSFKSTQRTLLQARLPSGELRFPELKQSLTSWFGYYFWKDDKTFDLKNHIKVHEKCKSKTNGFTDNEIQEIRQEIVEKQWVKDKPLWSITIVHNCYPKQVQDSGPHTTVILKFHHSIGDGYSWIKLIFEGLCEKPLKNILPNYFKKESFDMLLYSITFPFRVAYDAAETFIYPLLNLPFRVTSEMQTGKFYTNLTNRIPMRKLTEIKTHYNVNLSSVVLAVIAGAVNDIMVQKGMHIPNTLPALSPLPIPGHSEKLRNYATGAFVKLPIGESDPVKRLRYCFKDYKRIKQSTTPLLMVYMIMIGGSYFSKLTKILGKNFFVSSAVTNFPAGLEYISYNGYKCVDVMFNGGLLQGCNGLQFCALSYVDGLRISPVADASVMTKDDVAELACLIEKHVDILHHNVIITDV